MKEKIKSQKTEVQIAFEMLEHVFVNLKSTKSRESNRHPVGHPERIEHDIDEISKEHLALLRAKLDMEIAESINTTLKASSDSSDRLGRKLWWLNVVVVLLTVALVVTAVLELRQ